MYDDPKQSIPQRQTLNCGFDLQISHRTKFFLDTWKIEYLGNTLDSSIKKLEVNIALANDNMALPTN
jgi:hypothetical protein